MSRSATPAPTAPDRGEVAVVADLPRDRLRNRRDAAPPAEAPSEITSRDVIEHLRRHPDFLEHHPEALRLLRAPSREVGEGVHDFQHFLLERLRGDLTRLNTEQRTLIAASRSNLASQGRMHKAVLAILAAASFEQLLQVVTTDLAVLLDVDIVTVGVESAAPPSGRLTLQGIRLLKAGAIDALIGAERGVLLRADQQGDAMLFGGAAGLVRSQALLRLGFSRGTPIGLLCLGTRQPGRFQPGQSTELLSFLARVLAITISQWLTPRG